MSDYATRIASNKETINIQIPELHLQQEVAMFDAFASLIKNSQNNRDANLNLPWINVSLLTQAVIDACYASAKSNSSETAIDTNCFL